MSDTRIDFSAPAILRKWPSVNKERVSASLGARPFNGFAEYAPETNPETKKKDIVWFALNDDRPLTAFAGIWTEFKGDRGVQAGPRPSPGLRFPDHIAE
jgi:hypothetical protein